MGGPGLRVADVEAERGLAVGPGRYQPGRPARPERGGREELRGQLASLVLERERRHGQPGVVGEQGDDAIHVGGLEGPGEPIHQLLLGGRAGRRWRFPLPRSWSLPLQGGAGALERAGHRLLGGAEDVGGLGGVESQHVAEDEDGALAGRQQLQGGDEGERDRFHRLVPRFRTGCAVGETLEQGVRVRFEPEQVAEPGGRGRFKAGRRCGHGRAPAGRPQRVQAPAGGDPVQPGPHRGAPLESGQALPGRQQRILLRVLGVVHRAENPVAVHLQLAPVRVDQLGKRVAVSGLCPGEQVHRARSHHRIPVPRPRANTDDRAGGNWAPARRPVFRPAAVWISSTAVQPVRKGESRCLLSPNHPPSP